jgi:hypothetical protein
MVVVAVPRLSGTALYLYNINVNRERHDTRPYINTVPVQ